MFLVVGLEMWGCGSVDRVIYFLSLKASIFSTRNSRVADRENLSLLQNQQELPHCRSNR